MTSGLISLDEASFESQVGPLLRGEPVPEGEAEVVWLVDFYAPWCSHCVELQPELSRAAATVRSQQNQVRIVRVALAACVDA